MGIWPLCQRGILSWFFNPLPSQLANREVRLRMGLLLGVWLDLAILLVSWCGMGLPVCGGGGESVVGRAV